MKRWFVLLPILVVVMGLTCITIVSANAPLAPISGEVLNDQWNFLGLGIEGGRSADKALNTKAVVGSSSTAYLDDSRPKGWYLVNYQFKDGSGRTDTRSMGSNSGNDTRMHDVRSYRGQKGDVTITHNRYDTKTSKLLVGVTYQVVWSELPTYLQPEEKASLRFERKTLAKNGSKQWEPPQQSVYLNQGWGVYFASGGTKYIVRDINTVLMTEKAVAKGTRGQNRVVTVTLGDGYSAIYTYAWSD